MKRKATRRTSIVPLVVLQAACAGIASVTPACGETESNPAGSATNNSSATVGVGGSVIVLAVNGFGGNVIALALSGFGGVPGTGITGITGITSSTTTTTTTTIGTTSPIGAGGSLIVLAVAGFGGVGQGGDAGGLGEGGDAGAPGASGRGSG